MKFLLSMFVMIYTVITQLSALQPQYKGLLYDYNDLNSDYYYSVSHDRESEH